jgi:hypothetical protein
MRFIALRSGAQSEDAASNGCLRNYDVSRVVLDILLTLDRIKRLEALEQARRAASPTSRPIIASLALCKRLVPYTLPLNKRDLVAVRILNDGNLDAVRVDQFLDVVPCGAKIP